MKKIFFLFFLLIIHSTISRSQQLEKTTFDSLLVKQANTETLKLKLQQIQAGLADKKHVSVLDPVSKWHLLYYQTAGWGEVVGGPRSSHDDIYINKKPEQTLSWTQIAAKFGLDVNDTITESKTLLMNHGWTPVAFTNDYMLVTFSWYYPNGNQTSGVDSGVYYFKKEE